MRRNILTAILLILLIGCATQKRANGFEDYAWGTELSEIRKSLDLEFISQDEMLKTANFKTEIKTWQGMELKACNFMFFEDKFYAVSLVVPGRTNSDKMVTLIQKEYGEGRVRGSKNSHSWETFACFANYYFYEEQETGIFDLMSPIYSAKINQLITETYLTSEEGGY